jgi:hypothetical protein
MKRIALLSATLFMLSVVGVSLAQQPSPQPSTPGQHQHMPMQGGMCPMMGGMMGGGMMGGGMMGMMGGQGDSPRIMQMRGEMMRAMGEVMMKYGKMMEGAGK